MTLYTPIRTGEPGNAETFNTRFDEIALAISGGVEASLAVIQPWTVLAAPVTTINLTGIPATYNSLMLVALLRSNLAAAVSDMTVVANGDTTPANYFLRTIKQAAATTLSAQTGSGFNGWGFPGFVLGDSAIANHYAAIEMTFQRYNQPTIAKPIMYKAYMHSADSSAGMIYSYGGGSVRNLAAISSLTLDGGANAFVVGSAYALYGII